MEPSWPEWFDKNLIIDVLGASKDIIDISMSPAVPKGEHFMSTILRTKVKYKDCKTDTKIQETSFVLKTYPPGLLKTFVHDNGMLVREINMYNYVLPKLFEILGKYIAPKSLNTNITDVLVLEDLTLDDFKTCDRIKGLDYEHSVAAIKLLAEFHGASYIVHEKNRDVIDIVKKEIHYTEENVYQQGFVNNWFKINVQEIKSWPGCEKYAKKINNIKDKIWFEVIKEILPNDNEIMVLNHGDFWTNNILFRYNNKNEIEEVKALDFQFSRWSSPAIDLHIFFILSLRNREYIPELIDIYLACFNKYIHPKVLTKDKLQSALNRTECFSFSYSVCILPLILLESSKATDLDKLDPEMAGDGANTDPTCLAACSSETYKEVFPKLLKYYEDIGFLR